MKLAQRTPLHSAKFRIQHQAAKAFHAPQRERVTPVQHPKPRCGMCGGKVHTRTDYRAPDPVDDRPREFHRKGDAGWWLCSSCDTGAETGMPRAA